MKTRALTLALLGWFFMFKLPHPELKGITISALVGFFTTEQDCREEFNKVFQGLPDIPGARVSECEQTEEI